MNREAIPYPGPRPFQVEDEGYFHGREREIRDIISLLAGYRLVLLHAQSGAGKSSLVAAGLQPKLAHGSAATAQVPPKLRGIEVMLARVSGVASVDFSADRGATNIYTHNVLLSVKAHEKDPRSIQGATLASHLPGSQRPLHQPLAARTTRTPTPRRYATSRRC